MMRRLFPAPLLSLALLAMWLVLNRDYSLGQWLLGAVVATIVPVVTHSLRPTPVRVRRLDLAFLLFMRVGWDVIVWNWKVLRGTLASSATQPKGGFITVPLIGFLSDKVGRKLMYIVMSSISLLLVFPMIWMIATKNVSAVFAGYIIIHQTSVLALASLENLTMAEIFGARHRYSQMALAKELAAIVATGIGPVVAAALVVGTGGSWWPIAIMIAVFTSCSLGSAIVMPEVAGRDLTKLTDSQPGEAIIGPFARRERARLGLPTPEQELAGVK